MITGALTISERLRARRLFSIFSIFNTFSFLLLSGNIITLYLIRLGASSTLIGLVSSFNYISFFFMFLGLQIVERIGVSRLFAFCWTWRSILSLPLIFSPYFVGLGMKGLGFGLVVAGSLAFQIVRGVGLVSNSPIMGDISEGRDRGEYLSRIQILTHAASILTGLSVAFVLSGDGTPLAVYSLFILAGILFGLLGGSLLYKLPLNTGAFRKEGEGFVASTRRALSDKSFRRFIIIFALVMFSVGMSRPFIIVYAAGLYGMNDSLIMYLSVIGSVGALAMGFIAQLLLDKLGAKPILVFFTGTFMASLLPLAAAPAVSGWEAFLFLGLVFFIFNLGSVGQENASQTYFYAAVKQEDQLNLGILYFFTFGLGGTLGSLTGGFLLDRLAAAGMHPETMHRIFFGFLFLLTLAILTGMAGLKSHGLYSVRSAINMIFSARDLRAIILLGRLEKTASVEAELRVIQDLGTSPSRVTVDELLHRLKSPSFAVRTEALRALDSQEPDGKIVKALITEVKTREFTTAFRAARILGLKEIHSAVPVLRDALKSEDYLLCAESMTALARLRDRTGIRRIELIVKVTRNPLLIIYGAEALRIHGDLSSLPILFDVIRRHGIPDDLRNNAVLAIAGILEMEAWFYPLFSAFLENPAEGMARLSGGPSGRRRTSASRVNMIMAGKWEDPVLWRAMLREMIREVPLPPDRAEILRETLSGALETDDEVSGPVLRFLVSAVLVDYSR